MNYNFDEIIDRNGTNSYKRDIYGTEVLPMWVADMDFRSPQPVIDSLVERARHGIFGYTAPPPALLNEICERMQKLYQWQIQLEDIIFLPGVVVAFNNVIQSFAKKGEGVLMQVPVYHPFLPAPLHAGAFRQEAGFLLDSSGNYVVDLDSFRQAITPATAMFLLCNPHNPLGRAFTRDELLAMAEICLEHDIPICSDEIHCDLIFSGHKHIPIASLSPAIAQNTVTLMAPSKTFNIAGLECSFAIVQNAKFKEKIQSAQRGMMAGVNLMGYQAALAAYQHGQEWLEQLLTYLAGNREFLMDFLSTNIPEIRVTPVEATYLAWLDCRKLNLPGSPYKFFLEQSKVALNDGATFGRGGEGFVRLNFGCPQATLLEGLQRMKNAVDRYKG